jgi:hypothetical protein
MEEASPRIPTSRTSPTQRIPRRVAPWHRRSRIPHVTIALYAVLFAAHVFVPGDPPASKPSASAADTGQPVLRAEAPTTMRDVATASPAPRTGVSPVRSVTSPVRTRVAPRGVGSAAAQRARTPQGAR